MTVKNIGQLMNNKAFTLIEILVAVLIIGILAAIAVPQYQKTMWKTRAAQLLLAVKDLNKAQRLYYLAYGEYATKFSDLDINWSGWTHTCSNSDFSMFGIKDSTKEYCLTNGDFVLFFRPDNFGNLALFSKGPYKYAGFYINQYTSKTVCYEMGGDKHFCKDVLGCSHFNGNYGVYFTCPTIK